MSLQSSNYSSKVQGFDHRSILCLSPPSNVNGAPLPMSNKGSRNGAARVEKRKGVKQSNVPSINLKKVVKDERNDEDPYQDISMLDKMVVP